MLRFLILKIFLIHVDLVVLEHASLGCLTDGLDLGSEDLILVYFLHEPGILLLLGGINGLRPA